MSGFESLQLILLLNNRSSWANENGVTPLHVAAEKGSVVCLQYLLLCGASVDAKDHEGKTPRQYAERAKQQET